MAMKIQNYPGNTDSITGRFVSHLEGAIDGARLDSSVIQTSHKDRPIWVRYDLDAIGAAMTKEKLAERAPDMWRYRELLPAGESDEIISLGEGMTPILPCRKLAQRFGLTDVLIKDESQLPTGSFKSRGLAMAVTMANKFGVTRVAIPTAGNAGGACAAYTARAGIECYVFMPDDTPEINQFECTLHGAHLFLVNGLITDCGRIVREGKESMGWFDFSTLKEPYRIEGKKTMGLELTEQLNWRLPDVILYPTGGGTGLIGMWKAFQELRELGWLESDVMPRMVSVQSDGCCPIVRAFESGERFAAPFVGAQTIAAGLRVPAAVGDFMILDAIRESSGCAVAVEEQRISEFMLLGALEGIAICPETATCIGALEKLSQSGWIRPDDKTVIFNTGAAQKYPQSIKTQARILDKDTPIDWDSLR